MTLIAYQHETRSKAMHLRVQQSLYSEQMKMRLRRVGSPARWVGEERCWSYPLTPAAVVALAAAAREMGETIEWRDGLREFADAHLKQADSEHQVRIAMERIIRDKPPLPEYVTRRVKDDGVTPIDPLYHQQVAYHWSQRVGGLLLAHEPGCGKTRAASDASGGWYRHSLIRPMTPAVQGGKWGVEGGVLVVCPKTVLRTWQQELAQWQNASSIVVRGSPAKKKRLAATPSHYHLINPEGLKYVEQNHYDGLILDECFVAGTLVWAETGPKPIERVQVGERIFALNEITGETELQPVTFLWQSDPRGALLDVVTERGAFRCTEGHPFATQRGYVAAAHLLPSDIIRTADAQIAPTNLPSMRGALSRLPKRKQNLWKSLQYTTLVAEQAETPRDRYMSAVWGNFSPPDAAPACEDVQPDMLCSVEDKSSRRVKALRRMPKRVYARRPITPDSDLRKSRMCARYTAEARAGEWHPCGATAPRGAAHGRFTGADVHYFAPHRVAAKSTWRKWARPNQMRSASLCGHKCALAWMAGARFSENRRSALPLETGSHEHRFAGRYRGRRRVSPSASATSFRPAEEHVATRARVVSVSVYQPRRGEGCGPARNARISRVFNLEVASHHNYFVGETPHLTHNCHRFANNTGQTQHALALSAHAKKRLGLSGTPIANSLESIFYPLLILDGGKALGASKTAFLEKFFHAESRGQFTKQIPNEGAAQAIAAAMAESTHFVTKEEVLPFLPKKTHTPLYLEMTPEQERYYNDLKKEAVAYIQDAEVTVEQASARMMKLLQVCQGFVLADDGNGRHFNNAKTDALFDMLTDTLAGRKVIVWCYFKYEIAQVVAGLRARGIKAVHVDGDVTSQRQRDADVDAWNKDPSVKVFVRQLGMSEGVTLIANESGLPCYDNIYCGLSYKYIEWKQSQDRIHRIGQEIPCSYTYLLTENGMDSAVYENVLRKNSTAQFVHEHGKDYYLNLLRAA